MFRRRKRIVPQLNATSTADISFMLLIFFLVTTSMDLDKGLTRRLPPAEKSQQEESRVNKNSLLVLTITADNRLLVDEQLCLPSDLRGRIEDFVLRQGRNHMIQIQAHPEATYDTYFHVQNAIAAAYGRLRNRLAMKMYNRRYAVCSPEEKENIAKKCPQRVSEDYRMDEKGGTHAHPTE